jgi:acetyl-CoA C-acetyltransferase
MEAYIVGACRTAIGKFNGTLAPLNAIDIGAAVIKEIVARTGVSPDQVNEVIFGNVIQAGLGQNPARQAAIKGCLPETVPAFTVNKVCGSGLKTVALAGQSIAAGDNQIVLAGGTEHMTAAPYLLKAHRFGQRLGHGEVTDSVVHDALWDKFYDCHMATTAENIAEKYQISRADQDAFSQIRSKR